MAPQDPENSTSKRENLIFLPDSNFKGKWDNFIGFVVLLYCLVFPFRIAFILKDNEDESLGWII